MPKTALPFWKEVRLIESLGRLDPIYIHRVLTRFFRFSLSLTLLTREACCFEENLIFVILQGRRRSRKMKTWIHSISMSLKQLTRVWVHLPKLSLLLLKARRKITSLTGTPSWPGFSRILLEETQRPLWLLLATPKLIVWVKLSAHSNLQIEPSKSWWKCKPTQLAQLMML